MSEGSQLYKLVVSLAEEPGPLLDQLLTGKTDGQTHTVAGGAGGGTAGE